LGGVPISVVMPPSNAAKASGISSREEGISVRRAISTATGSISAATPTFGMNAERAPPTSISAAITAGSRRPATCSMRRLAICPLPLRLRPSLRMNIAHTVTTASLLNPESASAGETTPVIASAHITSSATRSIRRISVTNRITEAARISRTSAIS
jgi:hypothetical protein